MVRIVLLSRDEFSEELDRLVHWTCFLWRVVEVTATLPATSLNCERSLQAREWPAWAPPSAAVEAWNALQGALVLLGWRVACRADPGAWWTSGNSVAAVTLQAEAVEACKWCPVRGLCLDYALVADERDGVWGGTTPAERRALTETRR